MTQNPQDVKPFTNLMPREEFLRRVLYSGELTQVAQHIALVVFLVAEGRNQLNLSLRDLERITGWDRRAIKEHVDELEIFMRVTFGSGRAKAIWELQGVLEDAIAAAVVKGVGRKPRKQAVAVVEHKDDHNVVEHMYDHNGVVGHLSDHKPPKPVVVQPVTTNSVVAHHVATSIMLGAAGIAAATPVAAHEVLHKSASPPVVVQQLPTKTDLSSSRERESLTSSNISFSVDSSTPRAREETIADIQVNGVGIIGPDFKLPWAGVDQAAALIGMPKERARAIIEVYARDWAANGNTPTYPMAMVRKLLKNDVNEGQIHDVRLEKARGRDHDDGKSQIERMREYVREAEAKERKSWTR